MNNGDRELVEAFIQLVGVDTLYRLVERAEELVKGGTDPRDLEIEDASSRNIP
jgi:hypothetical protein